MKVRKDQRFMTAAEWDNFICAFRELKEGFLKGVDKPSLDNFPDEHAAAFKHKNEHDWKVHSEWDDKKKVWHHRGTHFLAWHRVFINEFENRLRREVSNVTIPYWNAFKDPFPEALKKISDNEGQRVEFPSNELSTLLPDFDEKDFEDFQIDLEVGYHNHVHAELGRTMGRRHSPRDAGFWLHHAFVDKQWGHWFQKLNGATPPSMDEWLKGDEIVKGKRVRDVLHTPQLGYVYGDGIFNDIEKQGSSTFVSNLQEGMILCAKLMSGDDYYAKLSVLRLTSVAAFITMQQFPNCLPGAKVPIWPADTMYCDLRAGKVNVSKEQAHILIVKTPAGSNAAYRIEAVNGTKLEEFTGITDFTANNGAGAVDEEMLYI